MYTHPYSLHFQEDGSLEGLLPDGQVGGQLYPEGVALAVAHQNAEAQRLIVLLLGRMLQPQVEPRLQPAVLGHPQLQHNKIRIITEFVLLCWHFSNASLGGWNGNNLILRLNKELSACTLPGLQMKAINLFSRLPETLFYLLKRGERNKNISLNCIEKCSDQIFNSALLLTYLVDLEKNLIEVICCFSLSPVSSTDLRNKHQGGRDEEAAYQNSFGFLLVKQHILIQILNANES